MAKFTWPILAAVLLAVSLAGTGCSSGGSGGTGSGSTGSGGTGLETALARVSDTAGTRSEIYYDNTAELVRLVGKGLAAEAKGYGQLRGLGAGNLTSVYGDITADTGINLLNESYAVSAGSPPGELTLIAGGQDGSLVTTKLTGLGWKKGAGGVLAGPPLTGTSTGTGTTAQQYAIPLQRVQPVNSDVLVGQQKADLAQIGSPSGTTLAGDPGVKALADCLGNVVSAIMFSGRIIAVTSDPTELALGISQPASASATPHMVACVSWPTQQAADAYAANVKKALTTGSSPSLQTPYSKLLQHPQVTSVGGPAHVVEWQATPADVQLSLEMIENEDLPALPACARLPAAAAQRTIGC